MGSVLLLPFELKWEGKRLRFVPLSISFSSFFHWHSLSSYPLIIHVGVSEGTGEVILLVWMSHVFPKSVNYYSAEADFFERKKLGMTGFLRFRDGTESVFEWVSECVCVLEWVSEWESKRGPPLVTHGQNRSCSSLPFLCTSLMGKKKSIRKGQLIVDVKIVSRENCQEKEEEEREGNEQSASRHSFNCEDVEQILRRALWESSLSSSSSFSLMSLTNSDPLEQMVHTGKKY